MSKTFQILFVCSGNACRSPMAEGLLKKKLYPQYKKKVGIFSAGTLGLTGSAATPNSITASREKGVDITQHSSQGVTTDLLAKADLIIAMAENHKDFLLSNFPEFQDKTFLLTEFGRKKVPQKYPSIADPIGENLTFYRKIINQIDLELERILSELRKKIDKKII